MGATVKASILAVDEIERDGSGKSDGVDEGEGDDWPLPKSIK